MLNASEYTKKLEENRVQRRGMLTRLSQTPFSSILSVLTTPSGSPLSQSIDKAPSGKSTSVHASGQTLEAKDKDTDTEERNLVIGASSVSTEASQQKETRHTNVKFSESTHNLENLRNHQREHLDVPQSSTHIFNDGPSHVAVQVAPVQCVSQASPQRQASSESTQIVASSTSLALEQVPQPRQTFEQDAIWRSMEEHLCQIARELQALRGTDVDRGRSGPNDSGSSLGSRRGKVLGRSTMPCSL